MLHAYASCRTYSRDTGEPLYTYAHANRCAALAALVRAAMQMYCAGCDQCWCVAVESAAWTLCDIMPRAPV